LPVDLDRIRILFEDETILVVDKPAGLLTIATETEKENTLYAALRARASRKHPQEKIFIVHRLDREASGLLVFAKTVEAKENLQNQFKDHTAGRRVYSTRKKTEGKLAITHVHVVKRGPKTTLLEVRLETGRKHQIRVHLAELGHPIIGDKIYGSRSSPIRRLALHGENLSFRHPSTGKRVEFESRCPTAFDAL
jgi:23S rRNA pseudouridine1911/1915/1917 synthase